MKETLKNLKEGDIFIKISENESTLSNSIIEHNSLTVIKILKKVRKSNEEEDFYIYEMRCFSNYNMDNNPNKWELDDTVSTIDGPSLHSISFIEHEIYEMRCFSNYNIDNDSDKWELVDTVSTIDGPSLHPVSFIEHKINEGSKNEIDSYSFVVKDETNKIWEEAMKHYPRIFDAMVLNPKELEDFMNQIAGDNWKICLNSLGHSF